MRNNRKFTKGGKIPHAPPLLVAVASCFKDMLDGRSYTCIFNMQVLYLLHIRAISLVRSIYISCIQHLYAACRYIVKMINLV